MRLSLLLFFAVGATAQQASQTFDLPSLLIYTNQEYLVKNTPAKLSCQIIAGWSGASLHDVIWLKDGQLVELENNPEYAAEGHTLTIASQRHFSEGEYQCQGTLQNVVLSNNMIVTTQLISSPLKLRRARITKFERVKDVVITVKQGTVARLPCPGLPDVVPGPAELSFEKEETNETLGSPVGVSRFLVSGTGMQIAMVQPSDSGHYYCVVRNEYTRQERKAPRPVVLTVLASDDPQTATLPPERTEIEYPTDQQTSVDRPITVDVVAGNDIIMECVMKNAKITWERINETLTLGQELESRVRQIWGNLRVANVSQSDAGHYICRGRSHLSEKEELLIYYELVVHAPTDVHLSLYYSKYDRSWTLSCYAHNLRYEIPMVFVNATPLIDAVDQMGIPTSTNFYTNPINVTMIAKRDFSGSVQCISRPAMEEAEIYGSGLERGRSRNYFIISDEGDSDSLIIAGPKNTTVVEGETAELNCRIKRVHSKYWLKDGAYLRIFTDRVSLQGSNTLNIKNVVLGDEGWYMCVVEDSEHFTSNSSAYLSVVSLASVSPTFPVGTTPDDELKPKKKFEKAKVTSLRGFVVGNDVRLQWTLEGEEESIDRIVAFIVQHQKEGEKMWTDAARSPGHIRAVTVTNLEPFKNFKFRVTAVNDDKSASTSPETDPMETMLPMREYKPIAPILDRVESVSSSQVKLSWTHTAPHNHSLAHRFIVVHSNEAGGPSATNKIEGNRSSHIIGGLSSNTTYSFHLIAENDMGQSPPSNTVVQRTLHPSEESNGLFLLLLNGINDKLPPSEQAKAYLMLLALLTLIVLLFCCTCCICIRRRRPSQGANKFIDTAYHIYNQQKVQRSKQIVEPYDPSEFFAADNVDENFPLRGNNNEDRVSLNSRGSHRFRMDSIRRHHFPNLYGEDTDDEEETDHMAPLEPPYGMVMSNGVAPFPPPSSSARCFSSDTGRSREVLVPPPPPLLSNGGLPTYTPSSCSTPLPPIPPLISATCSPLKTTISYKPGEGTIAYSPASVADSGGSGSAETRTTTADSPTHPLTDGSDNGGVRGDSSRTSQISSADGRFIPLQSFKAPPLQQPTLMSTFAR